MFFFFFLFTWRNESVIVIVIFTTAPEPATSLAIRVRKAVQVSWEPPAVGGVTGYKIKVRSTKRLDSTLTNSKRTSGRLPGGRLTCRFYPVPLKLTVAWEAPPIDSRREKRYRAFVMWNNVHVFSFHSFTLCPSLRPAWGRSSCPPTPRHFRCVIWLPEPRTGSSCTRCSTTRTRKCRSFKTSPLVRRSISIIFNH